MTTDPHMEKAREMLEALEDGTPDAALLIATALRDAHQAGKREGMERAAGHSCGLPDMGSYDGQIVLVAPDWLKDKWPTGIGIDVCLALEIQGLWKLGIKTTGHCCGHGKAHAYIGVWPESVTQMLTLGYEQIDQHGHFRPKAILSEAPHD